MAKPLDRPVFTAEGNRAYITVTAAKAAALGEHLRNKGIRTGAAEAADGGNVIIEVGGVFEPAAIEKIVRAWEG